MAEEQKALSCPFCGGRSHHILGARQIRMLDVVKCLDCFAEIQGTYEPESALSKWNTRAQLPSQGGEAVEVVAHLVLGGFFHGGSGPELGDIDYQIEVDVAERLQRENVKTSEDVQLELMTVAQHQRILAASVGSGEAVAMKTHGAWDGLDDLANLPDGTKLYTHPADQVADDLTMVKVPRDLLQDLRDLAFDQVEHHRAAMGAYKQTRQSAMDSVLAQADALLRS